MKIYTRRGDGGETDLLGGRVAKDHLRVEAYGAVDELNASLGACAAVTQHTDLRGIVQRVQEVLFELGGELARAAGRRAPDDADAKPRSEEVAALEQQIDRLEEELAPLKHFILPGGCEAAALFHVARTACRRAERRTVRLHRDEPLREVSLRYLNRLSDLLFVMARVENHRAGIREIEWRTREPACLTPPRSEGAPAAAAQPASDSSETRESSGFLRRTRSPSATRTQLRPSALAW
jgi:cob(I)alamin adenosyltransferase